MTRIRDLSQILKQQRISLNSKLKIETMTSVNIQMYKKNPQNHKKLSNTIEKWVRNMNSLQNKINRWKDSSTGIVEQMKSTLIDHSMVHWFLSTRRRIGSSKEGKGEESYNTLWVQLLISANSTGKGTVTLHKTKQHQWEGEMGMLEKCMQQKHEHLSLILRTHQEKPQTAVHTCNHSTEKVKAEGTGKICTPKQERDCCLQWHGSTSRRLFRVQ